MPNSELPSIAIIGPGRVGTTLSILLQEKTYPVKLAGRDLEKTTETARALGIANVCTPEEAAKTSDIVFLAVSDDAIESLCSELVEKSAFRKDQTVLHLSGALSSTALITARDTSGAKIASAHPLQTFSSTQSARAAMPGTFWFCEGDSEALDQAFPLIIETGGKPRVIPTEKKVLYHAASVLACNYLVSLMDIALTVAESAELDRGLAWEAFKPLIQATLTNIDDSDVTTALTGPIARGDIKTIERHLQALNADSAELATIYKTLGDWTTKIAEKKGLDPATADELRTKLKPS